MAVYLDYNATAPIRPEARSLNLATSAAIALFEALRQTEGLPEASGRNSTPA